MITNYYEHDLLLYKKTISILKVMGFNQSR